MKNFDDRKFREKLQNSMLEDILTCTDVNTSAELLVSKLTTILNKMAPIKTVQTNYAPWLADDTRRTSLKPKPKQLSPMSQKTGDSTEV